MSSARFASESRARRGTPLRGCDGRGRPPRRDAKSTSPVCSPGRRVVDGAGAAGLARRRSAPPIQWLMGLTPVGASTTSVIADSSLENGCEQRRAVTSGRHGSDARRAGREDTAVYLLPRPTFETVDRDASTSAWRRVRRCPQASSARVAAMPARSYRATLLTAIFEEESAMTDVVDAPTAVKPINHWIAGGSYAGESGRTAAVYNPATGEQTGAVDLATRRRGRPRRRRRPRQAYPDWRATSLAPRRALLRDPRALRRGTARRSRRC